MDQKSYLPIYNVAFVLLKDLHQRVPKFSKLYKYTLGEKMLSCATDILSSIANANTQKDMNDRVRVIESLIQKTDDMLLYIRLAEELKLFNNKNAYPFLVEKVTDISRQATGWKNIYIPQNL